MSKKAEDPRPIGVFDSGLGGLTVVSALAKTLPHESIVYLGDTARVPYGGKSKETLERFARQDAAFLARKNVKMIIAACNTVSAVAMDSIRSFCEGRVAGVLEAGIRAAVSSGARKITVIGTRATIGSGAYVKGILEQLPDAEVRAVACPLLVPLAEEGVTSGALAEQVFDMYLANERRNPPDALLLGCTHYPLFTDALNAYFGGGVSIIDSAGACASFAGEYLKSKNIEAPEESSAHYSFHATDVSPGFEALSTRFFGSPVGLPHRASLED